MLIFRLENGKCLFPDEVKEGEDWNFIARKEHISCRVLTKGVRTKAWVQNAGPLGKETLAAHEARGSEGLQLTALVRLQLIYDRWCVRVFS